MANDTKETTEPKPVTSKITPASNVDANRKAAATSRKALVDRLKVDLKKAGDAAREELKLANAAARDEIAVLKDQLAAALKREAAIRKLSEKKIKKMLAAGERWEKKQRAKLKKAAAKARKRLKK